MIEPTASLLVVDSDRDFARMLAANAKARSYRVRAVASVAEALTLIEREAFDAVLVELAPGAESAFELCSALRGRSAETEVIVMASGLSPAAAIQWFDPEAFAFVRKSDVVQLFAVVARALERRRITAQNRRLVWELQTINEISAGMTRSLDLDEVLMTALRRLTAALSATGGSIRLRNDATGDYDVRATFGPAFLREFWAGQSHQIDRPSDRVIATRAPFVVDDYRDFAADGWTEALLPLRSAISVPMFAGDQLLGTLALGSGQPRRFREADQQLLATIAGHIVVAIENALLHQSISTAKLEWEQTFDAISEPIAVFNGTGELLRGNRALAAHLSLPVTSMRLLTCSQVGFCDHAGHAECFVTAALKQRESRGEVTLADGQIFSVTTFPVGAPGPGPSVVQIAKDVTEEIRSARRLQQMSTELAGTNGRLMMAMDQLRATQAQLVQAEKLSAIGHLVAGVAHELNNPLTSVIGYAQLVEEELRDGPSARPAAEVSQDLRRIAEESERAARIVRNLLAFARRQTVARAPQTLAEIASRVLALREYEFKLRGITLDTDLPIDAPQVLGDAGQLQQLLLNLVLNAEQAMRGGDVKNLSVAIRHEPEFGTVELTVTDSGHGVDPANLSRVFDPFFTTREVGEGTGLGLSICYGIVRDHGGHIRLESKPRVGTTVRVVLPARLPEVAVANILVLVAHPDQSEREFMAAALAAWGYRVTTVASTDEALEAYVRPSVQMAIVDSTLVASDVEMWRRVRRDDDRDVTMILTSLAPDDRALELFGKEEASAALVPPVELRALHTAIRAGLKECV
jgi:two-component system, NtrC family, sensor kinase